MGSQPRRVTQAPGHVPDDCRILEGCEHGSMVAEKGEKRDRIGRGAGAALPVAHSVTTHKGRLG